MCELFKKDIIEKIIKEIQNHDSHVNRLLNKITLMGNLLEQQFGYDYHFIECSNCNVSNIYYSPGGTTVYGNWIECLTHHNYDHIYLCDQCQEQNDCKWDLDEKMCDKCVELQELSNAFDKELVN